VGPGGDEYSASARDAASKTQRGLAVDLAAEIRKLDRRIIKFTNSIQVAVTEQDFTHTDLRGIGTLRISQCATTRDTIAMPLKCEY
jgi:hypothetical protein